MLNFNPLAPIDISYGGKKSANVPIKKAGESGAVATRSEKQIKIDYEKIKARRSYYEKKIEEYEEILENPSDNITMGKFKAIKREFNIMKKKKENIDKLLEIPPIDWSYVVYDSEQGARKAENHARNDFRRIPLVVAGLFAIFGLVEGPAGAAVGAGIGTVVGLVPEIDLVIEEVTCGSPYTLKAVEKEYLGKYSGKFGETLEAAILYRDVMWDIYPELDPRNPNFKREKQLTPEDLNNFLKYSNKIRK